MAVAELEVLGDAESALDAFLLVEEAILKINQAADELGSASEIAFGDFERAAKKSAAATQHLLDQVGFISKGQFDVRVSELTKAFEGLRNAGVTGGPIYEKLAAEWQNLGLRARASGIDIRSSMGGLREAAEAAREGAGRVTAAWEGTGPVIKKTANVATDALRNIVSGATDVKGALTSIGSGIALKGVEEAIEGALERMATARAGVAATTAEASALTAAWRALAAVMNTPLAPMTALVALAATTAAAAGAVGYMVSKVAELIDVTADAEAATSRMNDPTRRQLEMYDALGEKVGMTGTRLRELFPTLDKLTTYADRHPASELAKGLREFSEEAQRATRITTEFNKEMDPVARVEAKARVEAMAKAFADGGYAIKGYGERLAELGQKYREATPKDFIAQGEALDRQYKNLQNTFKSTSAAIALMAGDLIAFEEQAKRTGEAIPEALKPKIFAAHVADIVRSAESLFPDALNERAKQLASAFDVITIKSGSTKIAAQVLGAQINQVSADFAAAGKDIPAGFERITGAASFGPWMERVKAEEAKFHDDRRTANRAAIATAIEQSKHWADAAIADAEKVKNAYAAVRVSQGLETEDDTKVNVDRADPRFAAILEKLKAMKAGATQFTESFVATAKSLASGGNVSGLQRLIASLKEQAEMVARIPSPTSFQAAKEFTSLASSLSSLLALLKGLGPAEARAMGGPVSGGSLYMVGERGPEPFIPASNGRVVSNQEARSMFGGSPEVVAELKAMRNEMRTLGSRPIHLNATVEADGKAIAKLVRFHRERNQDS